MSSETIVSNDSPVCFVGGASIAENAISAVFSHVEAFIGVDGGADHLLAASVRPAAVIGDLDSLSAQARATFGPQLCYVAEQLTTDFEKALIRVKTPLVLALGFTGGRLDHTLSVLSVMARYDDRAIILVDAQDVSFVARLGQTSFDVPEDVRVSIMPLTVATVTVSGLQWPFTETRMTMDGFTSASNAAIGGAVSIQTDGPVLVTLPRAFLPIAMQAAARG